MSGQYLRLFRRNKRRGFEAGIYYRSGISAENQRLFIHSEIKMETLASVDERESAAICGHQPRWFRRQYLE